MTATEEAPISISTVPVDADLAKKLTNAARKTEEWRAERDRLIVEAVRAGGGLREVARMVGLTHPAIIKTVERAP